MTNRTLLKDLKEHVDAEVTVCGRGSARRDHGKIVFFVLEDRSSQVQCMVHAASGEPFEKMREVKDFYVLKLNALVKERPENMKKSDEPNGDLELEIKDVQVLAKSEALPFDMDSELNIETHLDHLPLTLRKGRYKSLFLLQSALLEYFDEFLRSNDFMEFKFPAIVGGDAEGGAGVFSVNYFKDTEAYLATSPQLYKQIMAGAFERVFTVGKVFRAEKHATTRHLSEYNTLDFEMAFIENHEDIMNMLEELLRHMVSKAKKDFANAPYVDALHDVLLPEGAFPRMTLSEAQELIYKESGRDNRGEPDLEPEDERFLCKWAKEEKGSDFVFVTHFPVSKRPFYTYEDEKMPGYTKSFDLLFRGLEITTGGQRIHDYEKLLSNIEKWGLDPDKFKFYLQSFKYGMPPHGGVGMGLERLTARMLEIKNVKEATLFPRDMTRIDISLSELKEEEQAC